MLDPHKLRRCRETATPTQSELDLRAFNRGGKPPKDIRGITQHELAQRVNAMGSSKRKLNHTYISRLETPAFITDPSLSTIEKLAMAMSVGIMDFISPGGPEARARAKPESAGLVRVSSVPNECAAPESPAVGGA